jgi:hypothetical protein
LLGYIAAAFYGSPQRTIFSPLGASRKKHMELVLYDKSVLYMTNITSIPEEIEVGLVYLPTVRHAEAVRRLSLRL